MVIGSLNLGPIHHLFESGCVRSKCVETGIDDHWLSVCRPRSPLGLLYLLLPPRDLRFLSELLRMERARPHAVQWYQELQDNVCRSIFLRSVKTTFKYVLYFVPSNFAIGISAVGATSSLGNGLSTVFFAPASISLVVVSFVWKYMFQQNGMINGLIKSMGLSGQPFLGSMSQALGVLLSASLYLSVGYFMVIFVAGMNEIPQTYYEAARVDGATKLHQFWYITLPLVRPTSFFVLIMSILQGFQVFDQIYILTGGGPFYSTTTTVFYAFQNAFQYYQFGYASCITVFIFVVQMVFSIVLFRLLKGGQVL